MTVMTDPADSCDRCQDLNRTSRLVKILERMKDGYDESTNLVYLPFKILANIIHRKNKKIDLQRVRNWSQYRKIRRQAQEIDDGKRFVMAVADNKVKQIHALTRVVSQLDATQFYFCIELGKGKIEQCVE